MWCTASLVGPSSGDVAYPRRLRLDRLGRARLLEQALPVALDTLQMRIHEIHRFNGIAARDRLEDPLMLGMRFEAAVGALEIDAPAFRRHQIEDAHDAIEDIVLGGIDDLEMEVAVLEIDGLTLSDARLGSPERRAHTVEIVEDSTLASELDGGDLVDAPHLVRLADLVDLERNAEL